MRVSIEHREKAGLLGGLGGAARVEVIMQVQFSEEERSIIASHRLEHFIVLERDPDSRLASKLTAEELAQWAQTFHLRIGDLMKGVPDCFTFDTPRDAKLYQLRLIDALKELKAFLMDNTAIAQPSRFEL
jgi:hypothetical protein